MKRVTAKFVGRLYYLGWSIITIGGILFINKLDDVGVIVASVGGGILIINFMLNFVFYQPQEEIDWSLVYPELAVGEPKNEEKK